MTVYAKLIDVSPRTFKAGENVTVNFSVYNNGTAREVTVEIKDENTGTVFWKFRVFSQVGESNFIKTVQAPNVSGTFCLEAYADGRTLPDELFYVREVWINDDLVWKDGKQIKTAWVELSHPLLEVQPRNKIKVVFGVIPIYSDKVLVTVYPPPECIGSPTIGSSEDYLMSEGEYAVEYEVYSCGGYDARDLLIDYHVFAVGGKTIPSGVNKVKWFEYTFPEAGNYMLLLQNAISPCAGVEVYLNGTLIGRKFATSTGVDLAFNLLNVSAGDLLEVYAVKSSSYRDYLCGINADQKKIVKERDLKFTLTVRLESSLGSVNIPIECKGYFDNWFGGKR